MRPQTWTSGLLRAANMDIWLEKYATYGQIAENGGDLWPSRAIEEAEIQGIRPYFRRLRCFPEMFITVCVHIRPSSKLNVHIKEGGGRSPRAGRLMPGRFTLTFKAFVHGQRVIHKADVHISIWPSSQASTSTQPGVYGQQGGCPPPARTLSIASTEDVHTLKLQPLNDAVSRASKVKRKLIKK